MITSSSDRNFLVILANVSLLLSILLTAIFNQRFAIFIPGLNIHADVNLFILVAVLFADKFESASSALLHTFIYGIMFDIYYTNSIGIFTLYVSFWVIVAMVIMRNNSNTLIIRVGIILVALIFKDLYLYFIYSVIEVNYIPLQTVLYRIIVSVPYNTLVYVIIFNFLSLFKRYQQITYSNQ